MSSSQKPIRLPPLRVLRVRTPTRQPENPCIAVMSSVLACWAASGLSVAGCVAVENQLRRCMDAPPPPPAPTNTINYHLGRMMKRVVCQGRDR